MIAYFWYLGLKFKLGSRTVSCLRIENNLNKLALNKLDKVITGLFTVDRFAVNKPDDLVTNHHLYFPE